MTQKINFAVAFVAGYWLGQVKHGWTPLIYALSTMAIEMLLVALVSRYLKNRKYELDHIIKYNQVDIK